MHRKTVSLCLLLLAVMASSAALATDARDMEAEFLSGDHHLICPAGDGDTFVIRARLIDDWEPVLNPQSPIVRVSSADAGLKHCEWGNQWHRFFYPVSGPDAEGWVTFEFTLAAGMDCEDPDDISFTVFLTFPGEVSEWARNVNTDLSFRDLSGDLQSNLSDISTFAGFYYNGVYDAYIDYNGDGVENLSDITVFSEHNGHACAGTAKGAMSLEDTIKAIESFKADTATWGDLKSTYR